MNKFKMYLFNWGLNSHKLALFIYFFVPLCILLASIWFTDASCPTSSKVYFAPPWKPIGLLATYNSWTLLVVAWIFSCAFMVYNFLDFFWKKNYTISKRCFVLFSMCFFHARLLLAAVHCRQWTWNHQHWANTITH
jgi:hypothetical protein